MKKHYWVWPIAIYLFLGGLGGGMLCFAMLFNFLVPGAGALFGIPVFLALVCLALGCFFLVFELGQPLVFLRVFTKSTSIIRWGAILLTVGLIFGFLYWLSLLPFAFLAFLIPAQEVFLVVSGIAGTLIMLYTGIFLASMKPHAFWSTPALPVLFTVSALSTGSALCAMTLGLWPFAAEGIGELVLIVGVTEILHMIDMALIGVEIVVLFIYVFLLRGAGNEVARTVAKRWLSGKVAPAFWGGMVGAGLLLPLLLYGAGGVAAAAVAPVLVLAGGLLLRFLIVFADDRRLVPGEAKFYSRLPEHDAEFLTAWQGKENLY